MKKCLDEGLLQAYLDGELSQELTNETTAHVAACEACASALADAENESALFATAFAPDEQVNVPTAALRARLNEAVARLETSTERNGGRGWSLGGFLASLSGLFSFTSRGAAAFASVLAVVALALVFFVVKRSQQTPDQAPNERQIAQDVQPTGVQKNNGATGEVNETRTTERVTPPKVANGPSARVVSAGFKSSGVGGKRGVVKSDKSLSLKEELLPGEKQYQTAIASLEKTIKMGGDSVLRPPVRVQYERSVALLDSAIGETRRVAVANPKDKDAVGFLMSAYQSKVELLTKVADQAQVAALGR